MGKKEACQRIGGTEDNKGQKSRYGAFTSTAIYETSDDYKEEKVKKQ